MIYAADVGCVTDSAAVALYLLFIFN